MVGGIEEYVPIERNIAWIGNPAYNRLTAFKAELQPDGQTIRLKNTRTNTYVVGADGSPISTKLMAPDFVWDTTGKGRVVARKIVIGGLPYNIYLQKHNGVAQLAAESLDVQGDVEFGIISLMSVGRRVPGQWFIKPVDKATFTTERKLTIGIRLP